MSAYPLEVYRNWRGQWRWKITATNGKRVAASTEGFYNRMDCVNNARITGASLANNFGCNSINCTFTHETGV